MTLLTETNSNSMVAKYDGDIVNIIAEKDDGDSKKIYITQLSRDDIKNMIAQRSNEKPLEERLKSDYKCRYNFRRPTIHQHRGYAKQLLNSLKDMDLIIPSPIKKRQTTRRRKSIVPTKTRSRGRGKRGKRRKPTKRKQQRRGKSSKTIKYTPYPDNFLQEYKKKKPIREELNESSLDRKIPIDKLSDEMPDTIRKLITNS